MTTPTTVPSMSRAKRLAIRAIILLTILVLAVVLVGPMILGSMIRSRLEAGLREKVKGKATVASASFSWPARVHVEQILVKDRSDRAVLDIGKTDLVIDWSAALGGDYRVDARAANVLVTANQEADGRWNVQDLFIPSPPDEAPSAARKLLVDLGIESLNVTLVDRRGRKTVYDRSSATAHITSADEPSTFRAKLDGGPAGSMAVEGALHLYRDRVFDLSAVKGTIDLDVAELDMANCLALSSAFADLDRLAGRLGGKAHYEIKSLTSAEGGAEFLLQSLSASGPSIGERPIAFSSIRLANEIGLDGGGTGRQKTTLAVDDYASLVLDATFASLAAAAGSIDGTVTMDADMLGLMNAAGSLFAIKPGASVSGKARLESTFGVKTRSKAIGETVAQAKLTLRDLSAKDAAGKPLPLEKTLTLTASGRHDPDGPFDIPTFDVLMGKAKISAKIAGDVKKKVLSDGSLIADLDLADVSQKLAGVLTMPYVLGGAMKVDARIVPQGKTTAFNGLFDVTNLDIRGLFEKPLAFDAVSLTLNGDVTGPKVDMKRVALETPLGRGSGAFALADWSDPASAIDFKFDLSGGLESLMERYKTLFDGKKSAKANGQWTLALTGGMKNGAATYRPNLEIANLKLDGFSDALDSWTLGAQSFSLGGTVNPQASAATAFDLTAVFRGFRSTAVSPLRKTLDVSDKEVTLAAKGDFDAEKKAASIDLAKVNSSFLRGDLSGGISAYDTTPVFSKVRGDFTYVPDKLGAVLAPFLPGRFSGAAEQKASIRLDGKAPSKKPLEMLQNIDGDLSAGLSTFEWLGFGLGGDLKVLVKDQKLSTKSALGASGGKLDLDGGIDLSQKPEARSTISIALKDSEANVAQSPFLEALSPIFAMQTGGAGGLIKGLIDFRADINYDGPIPESAFEGGWEALPKSPISGKGRLALTNAAVGGASILSMIADFTGLGSAQNVQFEPIDFTIKKGRVHYDRPIPMTIAGETFRWSGSIGLDKTLDMTLDVPVSQKLVAKNPLLSSLLGKSFSVPVGGTTSAPTLAFDRAIAGLAQNAVQTTIEDKLGDVLGGVLGGGKSKDETKAKNLLAEADRLFDAQKVSDAAPLYKRLRSEFKKTDVYKKNKARIDAR